MNKSAIWIIIIIVLVVIGIIAFGGGEEAADVGDSTDESGLSASDEGSFSEISDFRDAIAAGESLYCTMSGGADYHGEGWVKGRQYVGTITQSGETSNVLMKDACMWTWRSGDTEGAKICFDDEDQLWSQSDTTPEGVDFSCEGTSVSDSRFELPADVTFMEL